jgi:magnesium-transporting ATPase (P-type)
MTSADPSEGFGAVGMSNYSVFMKGAPERIISRCSKILIHGVE